MIETRTTGRLLPTNVKRTAVLWAMACMTADIAADEKQDIAQRFVSEAPPSWAEYEKVATTFQGLEKLTTFSDGRRAGVSSVEYKQNQECKLIYARDIEPEGSESVYAVNPRYSFILKRKTSSSAWALTGLRKREEGPLAEVEAEITSDAKVNSVLISPHFRALSDLVRQPTFAVRHVSPIKSGPEELVEVAFNNTHVLGKDVKSFFPIQGGTLVLDPKHCWCFRSAELVAKYPGTQVKIKVESEIKDLATHYPVPKKYVEEREITVEGQSSKRLERWVREFEFQVPDPLPSSEEFTLAAFGLPEPQGIDSKRLIPFFVWLTLAAVCLLAIAGLFRWMKKRGS